MAGMLLQLFAAAILLVTTAYAMPFNDDMVGGQLPITGKVMRPKAPGSVPLGSLPRQLESREAALALENPLRADRSSILPGKRLFQIHCAPCHGSYGPGAQQSPSPLLFKGMPSIDLSDPSISLKPDGHFFGYVYLGGIALMPAYGWKLSETELWQVVSYIREVQAEKSEQPQ